MERWYVDIYLIFFTELVIVNLIEIITLITCNNIINIFYLLNSYEISTLTTTYNNKFSTHSIYEEFFRNLFVILIYYL